MTPEEDKVVLHVMILVSVIVVALLIAYASSL